MFECANVMETPYDPYFSDRRDLHCNVTLQNQDLWKQFHEVGTEMIITKSGRRMFPALRIQVQELDPNARYCILLDLSPKSENRYKFLGGWSPAGSAEPQSPHRLYLHPDSPATGNHWMSSTVSFNKLKLTNSAIPHPGHVVLNSMHMYQPRVLIVQAPDPRALPWAPSMSISFPETQFIAVTAYQNHKIIKLKIDNNPFAKGFRENGQSRYKRKRESVEDSTSSEESVSKKCPVSSDESVPSSPEPSPQTPEICHSERLLPAPVAYQPMAPWFNYPCPSTMYKWNPMEYGRYDHYPYIMPQAPPTWTPTYQYSPFIAVSPIPQPQDLSASNQKPRKLTDFSIRAITES